VAGLCPEPLGKLTMFPQTFWLDKKGKEGKGEGTGKEDPSLSEVH